jgi:hypothetical protein
LESWIQTIEQQCGCDERGIMLGTLLADMSVASWKKLYLSEEEYKENILWEVELPSRRAS